MKKSAPLSIRITPTLKEALERLAEADKRSLASYVEIALQAHVDSADRKPARGSRK
jgi:predicted transcriptional regulator